MNTTQAEPQAKASPAMRAALRIRNLPTSYADTLTALFDTGPEDKAACEEIITGKIAAIINEETAAPELLEALKLAEIALCNCVPITPYPGDGPLVAIRAAIAKAQP